MSTRRVGPGVGLSVGLMVAGFALGILGVVLFVLAIVKTVLAPSHDIPGSFQLELSKGQWTVYEHTAHEISGSTDSSPAQRTSIEFPRLTNESVRVTQLDTGRAVTLRSASSNETLTQNSDVFSAVMVFDAPDEGRYSVSVDAGLPGQIIVARGFGDTFVRAARWIALMFAGGLLFLLGGVLLIVGIVRRRNAPPPVMPTESPAVG
ncbi:MAG TPA: hypothetical protein VMY34_03295 [Acidimicrobiales bacterium]|nr:hypothetical protein [Acidimicrobiales bacterium]